jgi:hypothetical protein
MESLAEGTGLVFEEAAIANIVRVYVCVFELSQWLTAGVCGV